MRYLGKTAKALRNRVGKTQSEMAELLEISTVQLSKIENDHSMPSPKVIEKYREHCGVDPYVFDWCSDPRTEDLPPEVQEAAANLYQIWSEEIG